MSLANRCTCQWKYSGQIRGDFTVLPVSLAEARVGRISTECIFKLQTLQILEATSGDYQ